MPFCVRMIRVPRKRHATDPVPKLVQSLGCLALRIGRFQPGTNGERIPKRYAFHPCRAVCRDNLPVHSTQLNH